MHLKMCTNDIIDIIDIVKLNLKYKNVMLLI